MGKELSLEREDFVVTDLAVGNSCTVVAPAMGSSPRLGPGVEECWMEVDGARMRYLRAGSGPALILVHGLLGYSFSWRYTMPALASYATVYAPDLLGSGFSDRPAGLDCCLRAAAERLVRFIERLGISSFDLLGTSHGGAVAMMAAAQCLAGEGRPRVRRLILVAPVNPYSAHGRRLAPFLGSWLGSALFRGAVFGCSLFGRITFGRSVGRRAMPYSYGLRRMYGDPRRIPSGTLEGYMAPLAKPGLFEYGLKVVRTWTEDLGQLTENFPKLKDIPTLLLWGSEDPAVYASSAPSLARHFAHSQTIVFPGVGHLPYEESPEEFNGALIAFLARNSARKS